MGLRWRGRLGEGRREYGAAAAPAGGEKVGVAVAMRKRGRVGGGASGPGLGPA